jgi:hypothetical protein
MSIKPMLSETLPIRLKHSSPMEKMLPEEMIYIVPVTNLLSTVLDVIDPVAASVLHVLWNIGIDSCVVNLISERSEASQLTDVLT